LKPEIASKEIYDLLIECWNLDDNLRPSFGEIDLFLKKKCVAKFVFKNDAQL
jgi:protein tyrosine kinase